MRQETRSALLLLVNLALLGALAYAVYYGYFAYLWKADFSKLSFAIIGIYFITAGCVCFGWFRESIVQEVADLLPGIALVGTVLGIILVLSALSHVSAGGGADFKAFLEPVLIGAGTAFQPTLLGVSAAVLLRFQLMFVGRSDATSI